MCCSVGVQLRLHQHRNCFVCLACLSQLGPKNNSRRTIWNVVEKRSSSASVWPADRLVHSSLMCCLTNFKHLATLPADIQPFSCVCSLSAVSAKNSSFLQSFLHVNKLEHHFFFIFFLLPQCSWCKISCSCMTSPLFTLSLLTLFLTALNKLRLQNVSLRSIRYNP